MTRNLNACGWIDGNNMIRGPWENPAEWPFAGYPEPTETNNRRCLCSCHMSNAAVKHSFPCCEEMQTESGKAVPA